MVAKLIKTQGSQPCFENTQNLHCYKALKFASV